MHSEDHKESHVGRRDFLKTTTMASMAATLPGSGLFGQDSKGSLGPRYEGKKRKLLFLSDSAGKYDSLLNSIKSVQEYDFLIS